MPPRRMGRGLRPLMMGVEGNESKIESGEGDCLSC